MSNGRYIVKRISSGGKKHSLTFCSWRDLYDWCIDTGYRHDGWRAFSSGVREATFYGLKGPTVEDNFVIYEENE